MKNNTPGPWVRSKSSPKIIMAGSIVDGHEGPMIGCVTGNDKSWCYVSEEEAEANACLFVAAPDLLEACEALASIEHIDQATCGPLHDALMKARAALAKAKGEK